MTGTTRRWLLDSLERAGRTFLQAALGAWVALGAEFDHLFTRNNLEAGVVGLALSLAVSVGAKTRGAPDSASLLPADVDPPQDLPFEDLDTTPDGGRSDLVTVLVVVALVLVIAALVGVEVRVD